MNPNLPVLRASTLPEMTAFTLLPQRLASWLAASMAFIGVFLASIGIYGLVAYNVGQRTREIGIRMALGALRSQIIRMVMSGAALLAGIGVGLGLLAASLMTSLLAGMLYGIEPLDPGVVRGQHGGIRHSRGPGEPRSGPPSRVGQSRCRSARGVARASRELGRDVRHLANLQFAVI